MAQMGLFEYFRLFFSANFRRQYLRNGLSDVLETFTDLDHACGSKSVKVSSTSDKPFPRYCRQKLAEKNDHIGQYRAAGQPKSQSQMT